MILPQLTNWAFSFWGVATTGWGPNLYNLSNTNEWTTFLFRVLTQATQTDVVPYYQNHRSHSIDPNESEDR